MGLRGGIKEVERICPHISRARRKGEGRRQGAAATMDDKRYFKAMEGFAGRIQKALKSLQR